MPSKSKTQQRLFGMVTKYLKEKESGSGKNYLDELTSKYGASMANKIKSIADGQRKKTGDKREKTSGMDLDTAKHFAQTKHKDLPEKVEEILNFQKFVEWLNESTGKSISKITKEDLYDCLKDEIPEGWEVFNYHIDNSWQGIKIRKKYDKDEIDFNEDGFKYKTVFLSPNKTSHYKILIKNGYDV